MIEDHDELGRKAEEAIKNAKPVQFPTKAFNEYLRKKIKAEKVHATTAKIKKAEAKKKKAESDKKEKEINEKVDSLLEQRIKDTEKDIKIAAEAGRDFISISASESDTIAIRLLYAVREWARDQGFELHQSYNDIYEPPHGSDDLPLDTITFLRISWE